jgi:hypothetical protein
MRRWLMRLVCLWLITVVRGRFVRRKFAPGIT